MIVMKAMKKRRMDKRKNALKRDLLLLSDMGKVILYNGEMEGMGKDIFGTYTFRFLGSYFFV